MKSWLLKCFGVVALGVALVGCGAGTAEIKPTEGANKPTPTEDIKKAMSNMPMQPPSGDPSRGQKPPGGGGNLDPNKAIQGMNETKAGGESK